MSLEGPSDRGKCLVVGSGLSRPKAHDPGWAASLVSLIAAEDVTAIRFWVAAIQLPEAATGLSGRLTRRYGEQIRRSSGIQPAILPLWVPGLPLVASGRVRCEPAMRCAARPPPCAGNPTLNYGTDRRCSSCSTPHHATRRPASLPVPWCEFPRRTTIPPCYLAIVNSQHLCGMCASGPSHIHRFL